MNHSLILKTALLAALATPMIASAESELTIGTGAAAARLDFRIIIPRILYLAVGTGNATLADNTTVDDVTFDYTNNAVAVGTGAAAATVTGNVVPVRVMGNSGVIAIASTNTGALTNAATAGDTIPWSQITVTSSDQPNFPSPAPSGASVNVAVSAGKITTRTANWTYAYSNSAVVPPGTYGSTDGTLNGRITYTATAP